MYPAVNTTVFLGITKVGLLNQTVARNAVYNTHAKVFENIFASLVTRLLSDGSTLVPARA